MTNTITKRGKTILLFAAATAVMLIAAMLFTARANAMGDRNPAGSVSMPADKTISAEAGVETKINFGKKLDYGSYYYIKIKPAKTGYIEFIDDFTHGNSLALCNAKKKPISRASNSYDDFFSAGSAYPYQAVIHYGVKKGTVYHIRFKGSSSERVQYDYPYIGTVKWTNKAVKAAKYGKSKKKAKTIKSGKNIKGLFTAGNKKAQWFKVKSKKKKTNFFFSSQKTNGTLRCEVYYKSIGKWYNLRLSALRSDGNDKAHGYLKAYGSKSNTYYLKIYPDYTSSGAYSVKWK